MNNMIDEKIRHLAKQSEVELPQNYDMDVTRLLNDLSEKEKPQRLIPLRRVVAMAATFVFVFTIGAYATINYVMQRMEAMDDSEKSNYVDGTQNSPADADGYSRALTENEEKRLEQLKIEYESKGRFPESEILQVDSVEEVPEDTLCFVISTSTFYFPGREMTDEELLEYLDFYYKRDYSITETSSEKIKENVVVAKGVISGEDAAKTAKQLLMDIYGFDLTEEDYSIEYLHIDADVMDDYYWIMIPKIDEKYMVSIDAKSGVLRSMQCVDVNAETSEILVDEKSYITNYENVEELLLTKLAINETISKAYLEYKYDNANVLLHGEIIYYFELENDTGYMINYDCGAKAIHSITYNNDFKSNFTQILQTNLGMCQIRGLSQKIIELQ